MIFLSDEADGGKCGKISRIKENQQNHFVRIEHLGLYKKGKESLRVPIEKIKIYR